MSAIFEAILHTLAEPVLAFVGRVAIWIVLNLLAFPIVCLVSTPLILVNAFFGGDTYIHNVASGYKGACAWVASLGPGLTP